MRKCFKLINSEWKEYSFRSLKLGDKFKLLDPNGYVTYKGKNIFTALSNPYINDKGVYTINC